MQKIILGMDISTTCTGVSLLKYNTETKEREIMYIGYVKFKVPKDLTSEDSLFAKSKQFTEDFINKYKDVGITDIIIEAPLPNSNNMMTVFTLARFNGMLSQSIYDATGIAPKYISSFDARKYGFPSLLAVRRYDKKDELYPINHYKKALKANELTPFGSYTYSTDKKYVLWELIDEQFSDIQWQYDKKGNLKKENFDASDSLVAILGWLNYIEYYNTPPTITDVKEEDIVSEDGTKFTNVIYTVNFCNETHTKSVIF